MSLETDGAVFVAHDGLWPDMPTKSSLLAGLQARQLELELPPEK
jgi:hypothetical protein